jgi:hypothetical protein
VTYQWGTSANTLSNTLTAGTQLLDGVSRPFAAGVSGLVPNTTYFFRLVAIHPLTFLPVVGATQSFTTPP